jgi:hypothetical protein
MCEKGIFTDPLLMRRVATRGGESRLHVSDIIFTSREGGGGRMGGDVVSYVEYAIAAVLRRCRKKICRACYRLLGVPHSI